ncbi:MAG TPA: hypothetical protein VFS10_07790 [Pyrinomonadaceae bacterium]|nr:hypothetical protein [Pyrinomonadaceae bacterium]
MKPTRTASITATALAALFFTAVAVFAVTTTLVVYPGNLEGWQTQTSTSPSPTPQVLFVFGPTPAPMGRGSVEFRVGPDGNSSAQMRQPGFAGTVLPNPSPTPAAAGELAALSYSTYAQSGGSGGQTPYLNLLIDNDNNGTVDDQLFFEPVYQNGTYSVVDPSITIPNQCGGNPLCVTPGTWQTWDALNGGWWALSAGTFGPPLTTLRFYRQTHPNARIVNSSTGLGGVRILTGGGAGAWDNFIGNVDAFSIGVGPDITIYDFEPVAPPTPATGGVIITELRTSGPGPAVPEAATTSGGGGDFSVQSSEIGGSFGGGTMQSGDISSPGPAVTNEDIPSETNAPACCDEDDFVELYNTANTEIAVQSSDGSSGWALVKRGATCVDPPVVVAVIPNGTIIPPRGHYLLAGSEYSLSGYAGESCCVTATPDQTLTADINDNRSVGLFNTSNPANFTLANRLDAVGIDAGSGGTCDLLAEGTKLLAPRGSTEEWSFVRWERTGVPQDTSNNAADFATVSTRPNQPVGDNPTPIAGAPGPQNTRSPVSYNDTMAGALIAPTRTSSQAPNRQRVYNVEACSPQGFMLIRRTITNNSANTVTRLRFRVVDITTLNSPGYVAGGTQAALSVRNSPNETLFVPDRGTVNVRGLSREEPPDQTCGGLNTSLSEDQTTPISPLAPGASIDVVFRVGVFQPGSFRFFVNVEALP